MEENIYTSLYKRSATNDNVLRTVFHDRNDNPAVQLLDDEDNWDSSKGNGHTIADNGKRRIVGILYSVSRSRQGEIFPLYEGRNTIGRDHGNDIVLAEATVNDAHASLSVAYIDFPDEKYEVYINDHGSDRGSSINGRDFFYGVHAVKDNDIIGIGEHYKLLLKLFEPEKNRLHTDPALTPTAAIKTKTSEKNVTELPPEAIPGNSFYSPSTKTGNTSKTVLY